MAQSLNTKVDYSGNMIAYLGFAQYGKVMLGDYAFEFFDNRNVENNMQFPWQSIVRVEGEVRKSLTGKSTIGNNFFVVFQNGKRIRFNSKEAGAILKVIREHIGNDKVVRLSGLGQKIRRLISRKKK